MVWNNDWRSKRVSPALLPLVIVLAVGLAGVLQFSFTASGPSAPVETSLAAVQSHPVAPVAGPEDADVTIVLFSDYRCPYCRILDPVLQKEIATDGRIRVVYRDWPLFGAASTRAARLAVASQFQGRHAEFHAALMSAPRTLDEPALYAAASAAGIDWSQLQSDLSVHEADIDALLIQSHAVARKLLFQGTPAMLVGAYPVSGAVGRAELRQAITRARRNVASSAPS